LRFELLRKIKISILLFLSFTIFIINACSPVYTTNLFTSKSALPDSTIVVTYLANENIDGEIEIIGTIDVNTRNLYSCDFEEIDNEILNQVRLAGGNALLFNRYLFNSREIGNCRDFTADIAFIDFRNDSFIIEEDSLLKNWVFNIDPFEGIYESIGPNLRDLKLGVFKNSNGAYSLIHYGDVSEANSHLWKKGNLKGKLNPTGAANTFKAVWINENRTLNQNYLFSFQNGIMNLINSEFGFQQSFLKISPIDKPITQKSATGFAISKEGYIVTNHHVIKNSNRILVRGINGDFKTPYLAQIVVEDSNNDLAILKVNLQDQLLSEIPYVLKNSLSEVGEEVYTLGYPLRATMGDEVKFTEGVVSSRTGFQGNISLYQVSTPTQPGNSGGPLFNSNGEIIGIISAKHPLAANASYAIKSNYLVNLIELIPTNQQLINNSKPSISRLNMIDQIKKLTEFIYIIDIE